MLKYFVYLNLCSFFFQLTSVCHEAALFALQENIDSEQVERHHFQQALNVVIPRTSENMKQFYMNYHLKSGLHSV